MTGWNVPATKSITASSGFFFSSVAGAASTLFVSTSFSDLLEHVGNMGSDDDLELPAAMDDAHGPIERVDGVLVRCAFICKDETQPRYAVVRLTDVFLAAHEAHDVVRQGLIL